MDIPTLRDLPRATLQKLAKENHIKANLKSDVIIRLLLERHTKKNVSRTKSVASSKGSDTRSSPPRSSAANIDVRVPRAPADPAEIDLQAEDVRARSPSAETTDPFATTESSIAGTPEPEADPLLLQRTVEMMANVDRIDKQTSDKITQLRIVAAKLRVKASDLRGLFQAERSMRVRMEDYLAYWTQTNPRWTYEEIWSGQIRVKDMYEGLEVSTSDEEDLEAPDNARYNDVIDMANQVPTTLQARAQTTHGDVEVVSRIASSIELTDTVWNPKRQREEDSDDEAHDESRYNPRARSEEHTEGTGDPTPPSPPIKHSVDKGKRKGSSQQIMSMMSQGQHQGGAEGSHHAGHNVIVTLGLSQKDDEDMIVRDLHRRVQSDSRHSTCEVASDPLAPTVPTQMRMKRRMARTSKAPL